MVYLPRSFADPCLMRTGRVDSAVIHIRRHVNPHDKRANTRRSTSVVLMLGQRRRRWSNVETPLGERLLRARPLKTTEGPTP